jgi:hypothetical protein
MRSPLRTVPESRHTHSSGPNHTVFLSSASAVVGAQISLSHHSRFARNFACTTHTPLTPATPKSNRFLVCSITLQPLAIMISACTPHPPHSQYTHIPSLQFSCNKLLIFSWARCFLLTGMSNSLHLSAEQIIEWADWLTH